MKPAMPVMPEMDELEAALENVGEATEGTASEETAVSE
jgi:hypothetical protein